MAAQELMATSTCTRCGQLGHWPRNCSTPADHESKSGKGNDCPSRFVTVGFGGIREATQGEEDQQCGTRHSEDGAGHYPMAHAAHIKELSLFCLKDKVKECWDENYAQLERDGKVAADEVKQK